MQEIRFNAFTMNCIGHQSPGLWTHPRCRSTQFNTLSYWTDLARILEQGLFDGVFLADVLGVYDVFGDSPDAALRAATQVPAGDPMLLIPAMAMVTENLGFGVTSSLSYEPVFPFARRMSTLDHLTGGRIAWNIVTSYLDSAARAAGQQRQRGHDDRYDVAEDYMQAILALWEHSWEPGAVLCDRVRGIYADPARVHRISHAGPHVQLDAIHLQEPSPQRTPVLYQSGSSPRGREFAARYAECVFVSGPTAHIVGARAEAIRTLARDAGRDADAIRCFSLATVIVAETDQRAQELHEDYRAHVSHEGALALMSGWTGIDLSRLRLDQAIRHVDTDAGRSALDNITRADPERSWTVRDVAEHVGIGGIGPVFVGSAATVASQVERWVAESGIEGFNLCSVVAHETFEAVGRWLVPELQRRGRYKQAYREGTLREKLGAAGPDRIRVVD